ncbi:spondin domain-containing protein [Halorussus lipolyticus]|uniref:spondin domain-containing protein n=1 Tax=Halorussus lipolyticus TaxID=3034024 RepID=UPI0023E850D0|nr:spondin domain-containing protein [Halorussus sp. DT80]
MTDDSTPTNSTRTNSTLTSRRTVLTGIAATLSTATVVGAQETTTEEGETTTGDETTTEAETTTERGETRTFEVRIVNISGPNALTPEDGEPGPVVLSPGAYAVHTPAVQLFAPGESASAGLEALAEDGDPTTLGEEVTGADGILESGAFDTPIAGGEPGPIGPGSAYGFRFEAAPGERLSFATMFVPSNDLFFAPGPQGIELFRNGDAVSGEVTEQVALWDAGTEQNEEPGTGPNQAPRQSGPDTGPDEDAPVRRIEEVDDGYEYPSVSDSIQVLVVPEGGDLGGQTTAEGETTTGAGGTTTTTN